MSVNSQHCGAEAAENMALPSDCGNASPGKRKKQGFVIVICVALSILAVLAALWLCVGFGPSARLAKALGNTLRAGSFTAHYAATTRYGSKEYSATLTCKAAINYDTRELTLTVFDRDGKIKYAVYDGYYLTCRSGENGYTAEYIGDGLQRFFAAGSSLEDLNLEQLLQDLGIADAVKEVMNIEKMERSAPKLFRDLNSRSWLRKYAGFSQSRSDSATVYTFQPELPTLATAVLSEFEDAFYTAADYQNTLEAVCADWAGPELELSVGLRGGTLSQLEYSLTDDRRTTTMQIRFTDIGNTHIDAELEVLEDILASAVQ